VSFSPDGRYIGLGLENGTAKIIDIQTFTTLRIIKHERVVRSIDFSPDGRYLAVGSEDNKISITDVLTGITSRTIYNN